MDKWKWISGVLGADHKIYCPPANASKVLQIDPASDAIELVGPDFGKDTSKWLGGVTGVNGKLYCPPANASRVLCVDSSTRASRGTADKLRVDRERDAEHECKLSSEDRTTPKKKQAVKQTVTPSRILSRSVSDDLTTANVSNEQLPKLKESELRSTRVASTVQQVGATMPAHAKPVQRPSSKESNSTVESTVQQVGATMPAHAKPVQRPSSKESNSTVERRRATIMRPGNKSSKGSIESKESV